MKNTVEKQSCSFEEYHELLRQVEELKHTVKLKEDYKQNWLNVIADMDMQLTEARRQVMHGCILLYRVSQSSYYFSLNLWFIKKTL